VSQFYLPSEEEKHIKVHIPLTPYFLYRNPETGLFHVLEKELQSVGIDGFYDYGITRPQNPYHYRFL